MVHLCEHSIFLCEHKHCVLPENLHTSPTEGTGNSWGRGGSQRPKKFKNCIKFNWIFQRGGEFK